MITTDITPSTRLTIRQCQVPEDLHEVLIERDIGLKDGDRQKTQLFFTNQEMKRLLETIAEYNFGN